MDQVLTGVADADDKPLTKQVTITVDEGLLARFEQTAAATGAARILARVSNDHGFVALIMIVGIRGLVALTCGLSGVSGGPAPRKGVLPIIVSSIIKKRRGGRTYLYAATSARVGGRPRIVEQVYLGAEDEVIARLTAGTER